MNKKFKNIGAIGLLSANLLGQPLNIYANTSETQLGKASQASNDEIGSQKFEYKDEDGKIQGIATITYPKQVAVGSKATVKIHFDWTNEDPDDVGICVIRGVSLMLTGAKYTKVSGVQKGKYALDDNRVAFIYDSGAVSGGKDITMEVTPEEAGEITISGALGYSQADPKVSADQQAVNISMTAYDENKQSINAEDFSMYVGDSEPTVDSFKALATDKDGKEVVVTADFSKADFSKAGIYDVVLKSSDGQSKTVKLTVNANKQSITGSDFSMYVGDAVPSVSSFKASATDKTGSASAVTADLSKVNFKVAGTYNVVLQSADGQSKIVKLTINANKQSITGLDFSMYVGDTDPTVASFKASATDKTGAASAVTADFSKADFSKAGTYDVVLKSADGQSKTVKLTVNANKQSITGSDFSMYVGDADPTVSSFKASATDKTGAASVVTADLSKANFKVAGVYDVVLQSADGQSETVKLTVKSNGKSLTAEDFSMYVGDAAPTVSSFKALATDKDGKEVVVTADFSKADFSKAGTYDVVLKSADGQSKTVKLTVNANKQSITGSDFSIYVGDAVPSVSSFKASATDKMGAASAVTADLSKVNFKVAGTYDVVLRSADGQSKTVKLTVNANKQSITGSDFSMYVGDVDPTVSSFKASATDKTGAASIVTADLSKANFKVAGTYNVVLQSADGQSKTVKLTVNANKQSITGSDFSMYVGDAIPSVSSFKASATDKTGAASAVTADLSKVNFKVAGTYDVVLRSADGQSKTVKLTVKANGQSLTAEDFSMYVGDTAPTVSSFKALATDKDGKEVVVTADFSKVDLSKAGVYDVVLKSADGQTKTVKLTVNANKQSITGSDFSMYVGDADPTVSSFKASATDKTGTASAVTADFSKANFKVAGVYDVVLQSADGQSKTVKLTVKSNSQSLTAEDFSMHVGDTAPTVSSFKALATDKDGKEVVVTADLSKADLSQAGIYDVVLKSADGQSKTVKLTVNNNQLSIISKDSNLYVGDSWAAADNFVSATDKDGKAVDFSQIQVSGEVDTAKVGDFVITYRYDGKETKATVHVIDNKETLKVKESTLYVGASWTAADNFVSATDKAGKAIDLSQVKIDGSVDTTKAGVYKITYTYGRQVQMAVITVKADQTAIVAKDTTIHAGDNWAAADNFVSAMDKAGKAVDFSQIQVSGEVDTAKVGDFVITYSYGGKETKATVHVIDNKETLKVKNTSLYVGASWTAADNFVSATDKDGKAIDFSQVKLAGSVDTTKAGVYKVTYTYGKQVQMAVITVKADQTAIVAKDSTIHAGDKWQAADNFVSAMDKDGKAVDFSQIHVSGEVNTAKVGDFVITYSYGGKETKATVHVIDNKETLKVKNADLYVGASWTAADNFVSATDKDGKAIDFSQVKLAGSVDTTKAGVYKVTYTYGKQVQMAVITVKADQTAIVAKDSTIHAGDNWKATDNFISATDKTGKAVDFSQVKVSGEVNTAKVGDFAITYSYGGKETKATVHVIDNGETLKVKNTDLYVGASWQAADNFVSATDKDGKAVDFSQVKLAGSVDTTKAGVYKVTIYIWGTSTNGSDHSKS
ncbi:bacterial Ig-like domain-containing protein [Lactococcus carnosus]|uniref:DUF5011 domain-containing protein n=1 Tax=Pseudolactococcus carnosus TaxID=2749961 RepID=A0ABT0ASA6_9LACT|nr:bacterial Ig-like domain-containing protein [Lactococcus carnosus]MCJ1969244.1 DUF5011 domain-containing protein [Lactococcus carnosus]MCJ1989579.1 DUF5011 domain-containing protein [Lactococcus carnosus]MCJ1991210.1 DUF5011 domain-containing protein [Lactococcus carnosus]